MIRLKFERLNRGWTQQEVAYKSKLHVADISRIESGRMKPYPNHSKRLVKLFNISAEELFSDNKNIVKSSNNGGNRDER